MLNVAFPLLFAGDDDGQAVFLADTVADAAELPVTALAGVVAAVVLETDRVTDQMVMHMAFVYMGGQDKFIFAAQELPCKLHPNLVGFLRRHLARLKRLDEMPPQVVSLVDGVAAGPGKFYIRGFGGTAEGGHQQLPVRLLRVADIVNGGFQS